MTPAQMDGMYAVLCEADSAGDAEALADAAWRLYGEAGTARAEAEEVRVALAQPGRRSQGNDRGYPPGRRGSADAPAACAERPRLDAGPGHAGHRAPRRGVPAA